MNYYNEYLMIKEKTYISNTSLIQLNDNDIMALIKKLNADLELILLNDKNSNVENAIKILTELSCFKAAIDMNVRMNVLKDSKNPTKKYLQARGAVTHPIGKRAWAGEYIGAFEQGLSQSKTDELLKKGRSKVIFKVLNKLKELSGLQPINEK